MGAVTVFVDDAVQGHLPMIGVTDGAPADGVQRIHRSVGGSSGWAFLLIFLGPIGWIVLLAVLAFGGSARQFMVRLPYTYDGLRRERARFRVAVAAAFVMVASAVAWVVALAGPTPRSNTRETLLVLFGVVALGAMAATFVLACVFSYGRPGIELDASGRWVTLRRVHPAFVDACEEQARRRRAASMVVDPAHS
jgi:hypothetical protein